MIIVNKLSLVYPLIQAMIKAELEVNNIKRQIKLLKTESINFDDFKENCEIQIARLDQELSSTLGLVGGIKGASKITVIIT